MATQLTDPWAPVPPVVCDFAWYSPGGVLFPGQSYQVNGVNYPPTDTTWTSGGVTYSTQYSTYTSVTVTDGTETATSVTPSLFLVPLDQDVVFDAIDADNIGVPKVLVPNSNIEIVSYTWDLGNGIIAQAPTVTTIYNYPEVPPDLAVTLTIVDSLGRQYQTTKQISIAPVELSGGAANLIREGATRPY